MFHALSLVLASLTWPSLIPEVELRVDVASPNNRIMGLLGKAKQQKLVLDTYTLDLLKAVNRLPTNFNVKATKEQKVYMKWEMSLLIKLKMLAPPHTASVFSVG
ncbi:hypothetical protein EDC04DRAFT_2751027 [Pisolithus marmoratus]|nr:hypothetical protein EDC04DRAFT_2751027 [Pisolithus marmoratus]